MYVEKPYMEEEPYIFISYSHTEKARVTGVLRLLDHYGVRFWYDQGINAGTKWKETIKERFESSSMFLCFLANGIEQRAVVMEEIEFAIHKYNENQGYKVLFVFLEQIPPRVFGQNYPAVEEFIEKVQHIRYEGLTAEFGNKLLAKNVIPDSMVDTDHKEMWEKREQAESVFTEDTSAFSVNSYICDTIFPEEDEENKIYKVRLNQMAPEAACLICLDNQWVPPYFFDDQEFWELGFKSDKIKDEQADYQRSEVLRALLHNRQLIINRAFFYNTSGLGQWYDRENSDYEAFKKLLTNGSFLVYLATENIPADTPDFSTNNQYFDKWKEICQNNTLYCLKMDWNSSETNELKFQQLLASRFQDFCLTMGENKPLLDDLASAFHFSESQKNDFIKTWEEIQLKVAARCREKNKNFNREVFYKQFLIREKSKVAECSLDIHKPFASELKEIVDFQYGINLPDSLGARAIYPAVGHLKDFYRSKDRLRENSRELSWKELNFAVVQFIPEFINHEVSFPSKADFCLSDMERMRSLQEWKAYIRAVENGNRRAHLQEVDFYDISFVWEKYYKWLEAARESLFASGKGADWRTEKGAVSIIYRFGNLELITVYSYDGNRGEIRISSEIPLNEKLTEKQTVLLTIDYVCADILRYPVKDNLILSELRLFEGITKEPLYEFWENLADSFKKVTGWNTVITASATDAEAQRYYEQRSQSASWRARTELTEEDFARINLDKYCSNRKLSGGWKKYQNLINTRPEQFLQDPMLRIETDLRKVCQYELEKHKEGAIGVRYCNDPYTMMVVDLVYDVNGKAFTYERAIPCISRGAVVCLTVWEGRYVMMRQYRHSMRGYQVCFPRGYGEEGISAEDNARKEVQEELGAKILKLEKLGQVVADSGLNGNRVDVFYCEIGQPRLKEGYEGIKKLEYYTEEELAECIKAESINDGFTLSALGLLKNRSGIRS